MINLENGWLLGRYFDDDDDYNRCEDEIRCYCNYCERPIYYDSYYEVVDGDTICRYCYDDYKRKLIEEEDDE